MEADRIAASRFMLQNDENNNLLKSQLCSSCEKEKATLICSCCTSQNRISNSDSIPALKAIGSQENLDDYYHINLNHNVNIDLDVDKLMKNGNLVYCLPCFELVHDIMDKSRSSKHIPVKIFYQLDSLEKQSEQNHIDDIVDNIVEQVVNKSEKEEFELKLINLKNDVACLDQRCKQFNDVKLSIKQMNDTIRDDLYLDFGSIATIMQSKLDEISNRIKEKLKDAYSVVRDIQIKIGERINEIDCNIKELDDMRQESEFRAQEMKLKESEIINQIQQINEELKWICEPNYASTHSTNSTFSCSLFVDNNLYPQFNYNVDLSQLIEAINNLNVQIGPNLNHQKQIEQSLNLIESIEFDASIQSSLLTDGTFWVQLIAENNLKDSNLKYLYKKNEQKFYLFLEEISRFIRSKRICDKEWQTYSELKLKPQVNDKCFCLDHKTRRWLRCQVMTVDVEKNLCQVKYLDTGFTDVNVLHSFEELLIWKDFDLVKQPYRAIKCVLYNEETQFETDIQTETKFLFKDLTLNQAIRCELISETNDNICIVRIYKITENNKLILLNDDLIKSNKQQKSPQKTHTQFASTDIRLENLKNPSKSSPLSSTSSFSPAYKANSTIMNEFKSRLSKVCKKPSIESHEIFSVCDSAGPKNLQQDLMKCSNSSDKLVSIKQEQKTKEDELEVNQQEEPSFDTNLEYSSVNNNEVQQYHLEENLDVEDQIDERRFLKTRSGSCFVTTGLSSNGIFWIKPIIPNNVLKEFDDLSKLIGDFIKRTNYKSYGDLNIKPELNKKCFIKVYNDKFNRLEWFRGFVEKVDSQRELCSVRLMDLGKSKDLNYQDVYPHRRLDLNQLAKNNNLNEKFLDYDNHGLKLNYLAIRCCLFQNSNIKIKNIPKFRSLVTPGMTNFNLIEQLFIGRHKCWYTELNNHHGNINKIMFDLLPVEQQDCVFKYSKSVDLASLSQMKQLFDSSESKSDSTKTNREWQPVETRDVAEVPPNSLHRSQSLYDISKYTSESEDLTDKSIKVLSEIASNASEKKTDDKSKSKSLPHRRLKNKSETKQKSKSLMVEQVTFSEEPEWESELKQNVQQPVVKEEVQIQEVKEERKQTQSKLTEEPYVDKIQPVNYYQTGFRSNYNNKNENNKKRNFKNKKTNSNTCKPDSFKQNYRRNDDFDGNNNNNNQNNRSHFNYNNNNQTVNGNNNQQQQNRSNNNQKKSSYNYKTHEGPPYLVLNPDEEDPEQNSSAFNDVFIEEEPEPKDFVEDDNSSLDQDLSLTDDLDPDDFQLNNQNRLFSQLNSSPNSPYQRLFKLHPHNSYEQVLSRISENDSLKNNQNSYVYSRLNDPNEEVEKIRSIEQTNTNNHSVNSSNLNEIDKLNVYDSSISLMPNLVNNNSIETNQGATLDQTHQIPNRHIINDIDTNKSINNQTANQNKTLCNKNRSFSAADAYSDRNLNNRLITLNREDTDSSSTSSLSSYIKKELDEDESFASCTEDLKPEENKKDCETVTGKFQSSPNKSNNGNMCQSKLDKMKKFTISIFVDDFEADSSNKTLSNDSSSTSIASNSPKEEIKKNESVFTVTNTRNVVTISNIHEPKKLKKFNSDFELQENCSSLKEFELTEAKTVQTTTTNYRTGSGSLIKTLTRDEEAFIFTPNPNQFNSNRTGSILASKPPLIPVQVQSNHLSTIIEISQEGSNDTENDCSFNKKSNCSTVKKMSSAEDIKNSWLNDLENNSNEFQKKIDFFNKLPETVNDIDYKNVTMRKCKKKLNSSNTDNENSSLLLFNNSRHKSRSVSSLSDNCFIPNSLSNNCLLETINSVNQPESEIDKVFEKFCLFNNDEIMLDSDKEEVEESKFENSKFVPNNSDRFKIKSKMLINLLNEPINTSDLNLNTDKGKLSSSSSEPCLSTETDSLEVKNKLQKSPTSLEISSYTTDSLFNSHLIITPICSDVVSPNQLASIVLRSPINLNYQQNSLNSTSTPNRGSNLKSPNQFPSPPAFLAQSQSPSVSHSSMSLPPPPPPPAESLTETKSAEIGLPPVPVQTQPVFPLIKSVSNKKLNESQSKKPSLPLNNKQTQIELFKSSMSINKHIDNYLNSVKASTGNDDLKPVKRKCVKELNKSLEWKSANFSLYGLDTDEDQNEMDKTVRQRSTSDSNPINTVPNLNLVESKSVPELAENNQSFDFPPPPSQFLSSPESKKEEETSSILPPPPEPAELAAILTNEQVNHLSSSSSATTVIPAAQQQNQLNTEKKSPRLSTFMKSIEEQSNLNQSPASLPQPPISKPEVTETHSNSCPNLLNNNQERKKSLKLDHLLDINPKRLYRNSKFRCRIHDIIRENGKFWLEVIYSEEDERKFQEIFKLFNLCSRISEAPREIHLGQRLSALYKGDWYRAIVLDDFAQKNNKVKVRFVDLGLEKVLDRSTDLREIDDKFFNCPLKALQCSIYIDENINQIFMNNQLKINEKLKLSKLARKHFVKMVYKKVLFAKVLDLNQKENSSEFKIKLGCQSRNGIIDVYMYLLSKYDRDRYELIKSLKNSLMNKNQEIKVNFPMGIPVQTSIETTTTTTTTTTTSNTLTSTAVTCPSSIPSPPDSPNNSIKKEEKNENEYENEESQHRTGIQINQEDEGLNYYDDDEDDDVLFSDAVNYYYKQQIGDTSSTSYYSTGQNDDSVQYELDLTPVKDQELKHNQNLHIEPVDLPPLNTPSEDNKTVKVNDLSTTKVSNRVRVSHRNCTPVIIPNLNKTNKASYRTNLIINRSMNNYNSDTSDTSMNTACCRFNLKKLANGTKNKQSYKITSYQETIKKFENNENENFMLDSKTSINKKVKFHIK